MEPITHWKTRHGPNGHGTFKKFVACQIHTMKFGLFCEITALRSKVKKLAVIKLPEKNYNFPHHKEITHVEWLTLLSN